MKRYIIAFSIFLFPFSFLQAEWWWARPTICQPSNVRCFTNMTGPGFEPDDWDHGANCRGLKLICPNAITRGGNYVAPEPMTRSEIASYIHPDFDALTLNLAEGCFGSRRVRNNGSQARVSSMPGGWVNVFCHGVLDAPDEALDTGEIILDANNQPTCTTLAKDGFIGVLVNGRCFGRFGYPESDFFQECVGANILPARIIILNGADIGTSASATIWPSLLPNGQPPATEELAAQKFTIMIENAAEARRIYAED